MHWRSENQAPGIAPRKVHNNQGCDLYPMTPLPLFRIPAIVPRALAFLLAMWIQPFGYAQSGASTPLRVDETAVVASPSGESPAERYARDWAAVLASAWAFIDANTPLENASSYWHLDSSRSQLWYKPTDQGDSVHWAKLMFVFKTLPKPAHTLEFPFSLPFIGDSVSLADWSFDNELERKRQYLSQAAKAVKAFQEGLLLTPEQALSVVQKAYPDSEWGLPELDRESFPPYPLRWEVLENRCNPCREVYVAIDKPVLLEEGQELEMVPDR
jgi:hypothetical protein